VRALKSGRQSEYARCWCTCERIVWLSAYCSAIRLSGIIDVTVVKDGKEIRAHSIMRNRFQINPDISETGFWFSGFLHSIGETETGFAKPSKPEIVHMFTLNYLLSSSLKLRLKVTYTYSTWSILKYFDRYIGNYERGTFLNLATSLYYFIIQVGCILSP